MRLSETDFPLRYTYLNSLLRLSEYSRLNSISYLYGKKCRLPGTSKLLCGKLFSALRPSALQYIATSLGLHSFPKAVHFFTLSLLGLKCHLHFLLFLSFISSSRFGLHSTVRRIYYIEVIL
jgi:hypothetical protein